MQLPYRNPDESIACAEARQAGYKKGVSDGCLNKIEEHHEALLAVKKQVSNWRYMFLALGIICSFISVAGYELGKLHGHERSPAPCKDEAFSIGYNSGVACTNSGVDSTISNGILYCLCPGEHFSK